MTKEIKSVFVHDRDLLQGLNAVTGLLKIDVILQPAMLAACDAPRKVNAVRKLAGPILRGIKLIAGAGGHIYVKVAPWWG